MALPAHAFLWPRDHGFPADEPSFITAKLPHSKTAQYPPSKISQPSFERLRRALNNTDGSF